MIKKFLIGVIIGFCICLVIWATTKCLFLSCDTKGTEVKKVIVHDTIYKDSFPMIVHDTVYCNAKWLRHLFETAEWKVWKNNADDYEVEYPAFMEKVELMKGERNMRREFHGISMVVCAYDDQIEMSVKEKYEAINMSAVTKSIADSSFMMAGRCGDYRSYFEKDIKLKNHAWLYLRVEFPSELTWAVDPLLLYVKNYQPSVVYVKR